MNAVKKNDTGSGPGKRTVDKGFATGAGKALVRDFNIMEKAALNKILAKPIGVNPGSRTITINQLLPARDINYPKGASHVR